MQHITGTNYDPIKKIWSGPKRKDFYGINMTLGEVILHNLSKIPEKVIQVMDTTGEELTAGQLIRDSKLMAIAIQELGLKVGDVIGINATNTTNLTAAVIGAFLCGTPIHAVFPGFDKESIKFIYKVSQPKAIFCDVETYDTTKSAIDELNLDTMFLTVNGKISDVGYIKEILDTESNDMSGIKFPCNGMTGDDTALILCSSGTTGTPKGVLCSHRITLNRPTFINLTENSVLFAFSAIYWASGIWTLISALINGVKRIITTKPYSPEYFVEIVEKHRITHLLTTPQQWALLYKNFELNQKKDFSHVRVVYCGGSKVLKTLLEPFKGSFNDACDGINAVYGMSEILAVSRNNGSNRREGTEGKLTPNTEVRIIGKDGQFLGPNEEGILHVRIPYKWAGYYRNAEATQKAYVDGWLITGDIGSFDDDGYLNICTRYTDVFKSSNFQIYPELIEEVIMQLEGVQEVCVFGVPDFVASNLTSCAVKRTNNKEGSTIRANDIKAHVQKIMATPYHIQGEVYFVDELPKTASGKILRRKVPEIVNTNKIKNGS